MRQLLAELHRRGIRLQLQGNDLRISAKAGVLDAELREALHSRKAELLELLRAGALGAGEAQAVLVPDPEGRFQPFALTELQHAYWLGRDTALDMGSVATHLYVELSCQDLDLPRAGASLQRLIEQHDMLRAVVDGEGRQVVLPQVPAYRIALTDCQDFCADKAEAAARATRELLSHQVLQAGTWPLFDIRATRMPEGETRLHVSLDLLILDAWSIFLFFREWHALYENGGASSAPAITYRDYVLAEQASRNQPRYRAAQAYWARRVADLPPAPELPLQADPAARRAPRFTRRETRMERARWEALKAMARGRGLTPSALLLAAYAEVLARWSNSARFTLNVTTGARQPWHPDVNRLLGDFTSIVLHEIDRPASASFSDFALHQQQRLLEDLEHGQYSGVAVRREWARQRGIGLQAAMPVVFSSGLVWSGEEEVGNLEQFGRKVFSISQTSQVWLDHHVMELDGDLVLIWDAAEAVFQPGVLDALFESYTTLVQRLADEPQLWEQSCVTALPAAMQQRREAARAEQVPMSPDALHAGIVRQALARPDALAVIAADRQMNYGELLQEGVSVADWLEATGMRPDDVVAVLMRKGWEQAVAVLGVLLAGGAYVPIDADLPALRQEELIRLCGARHVLTQPGALRGAAAEGPWRAHEIAPGRDGRYRSTHAASLVAAPGRPAYVIFTSGTTGVPKGVMIDHAGAVNTVHAINRMFEVGANDRVLGVSSLSFDLSVYDIFGVLGAGGVLVLPDPRTGHDPVHWHELTQAHGITLWNSAPQLMRMLLDVQPPGVPTLARLRTVLLSGDFIPLDLPGRLRAQGCGGRITSLGGATEASIWSIHHPIDEVDPQWQSIPYGRALPNQSVWVLDGRLQVAPDHVRGRIFIGGRGLALGYLGDEAKTAQRFIAHPRTGERLYDTGDLGRYDCSGDIVILGRDDGQIKIRGHRVELGEIEAVLRQHPDVDQCVVLARPQPSGSRQLAAYVLPSPRAEREKIPEALRAFAAERLPDYMVPRHAVLLERMPLSTNGKVDAAALPEVGAEEDGAPARTGPRNALEQAVLDVWQKVIPGLEIGVTDNFFELGGDSVLATQLLRELNTALSVQLEMHELFENLTIESLARLLEQRGAASGHRPAGLLADEALLSADVAAALAGLEAWSPPADAAQAPVRTVLLTGATGWVGAHLLTQLLDATSAEVICLMRDADESAARLRLREHLQALALPTDPARMARVAVQCGDLLQPCFGLGADRWQTLCEQVDAIYHLGASVSVVQPYGTHRAHNVTPLHDLLALAGTARLKPLYTLSPLAVCRRLQDSQLRVFGDERVHDSPDGLLTGYAQSKWVAEQILQAASKRGMPVRIYRSSHALPSTRSARVKPHDTYMTVLRLGLSVDAVPRWPGARVRGLPVDLLCELLVGDASRHARESAVVHLEPPEAPALPDILAPLIRERTGRAQVECLPLPLWQQLCLDAAARLTAAEQALARGLFESRGGRMAIENMFSEHPVEARLAQSPELHGRLSATTSPRYWHQALGAEGASPILQGATA